MNNIGNRMWRLKNIWWFIFFVLPGLPMFIAGKKVRYKKWQIIGALYFFIFFASMYLSDIIPAFSTVGAIDMLAGIIHSFVIIKEYFVRLDVLDKLGQKNRREEELRRRIEAEYGVSNEVRVKEAKVERTLDLEIGDKSPVTGKVKEEILVRVDINAASEEEIGKLPMIGLVLGKKIVTLREKDGPYISLEDFIRRVNLKPHVVERIKNLISFSQPRDGENSTKHSSRVVDY